MLTFLNIYLSTYICSYMFVSSFVFFSNVYDIRNIPLNSIIQFIWHYNTIKYYFLFFFFLLSGVPTLVLFYIKFNFIIQLISNFYFIAFCLIVLFIFISTLYYLQILITKNFNEHVIITFLPTKNKRRPVVWVYFATIFILNSILCLWLMADISAIFSF